MTRIDENPYRTTTRKRTVRSKSQFRPMAYGVRFNGIFPTPIKFSVEGPDLYEAQITTSEGHPFWANIKDLQGLKPDLGGNFNTTRWKIQDANLVDLKKVNSMSYVDDSSSHRLWQWAGNYVPNLLEQYGSAAYGWGYITKTTNIDALAGRYPAKSSSLIDMNAFGTTAIARTRPDQHPANLTQFLVELRRDGIPFAAKLSIREFRRLLKSFQTHGSFHGLKDLGDYFLEDRFGLKPFVSDLTDFSRLTLTGKSVIEDLENNSGKLIRRRYDFPHEAFSSEQGTSGSRETFGPNGNGGQFTLNESIQPTKVHTSRDTWFKGAYRIYLPRDLEPVSRFKALADKMRWDYGLDVDFQILWNLAPWSWLLDWEVNLGDVITNINKFRDDAVVLHYGYMMQKTVTTYSVSNTGTFVPNATYRRIPDLVLEVTNKQRIRATPYGFGRTFGSLSLSQKAILAAIGITRF